MNLDKENLPIGQVFPYERSFNLRYDLHVHTHYSDGLHSPKKVIDKARSLGLRGIAITDHDSNGYRRSLIYSKEFEDFELIPGIELSCIYRDDEVHILATSSTTRKKSSIILLKI